MRKNIILVLNATLFITQYDMDPHYMAGIAEKVKNYGDLWGLMGIYGDLYHRRSTHKSP